MENPISDENEAEKKGCHTKQNHEIVMSVKVLYDEKDEVYVNT
jgi:hypothetical protein